MSADLVSLEIGGVGHVVEDTAPRLLRTSCGITGCDNGKRYPISRLTCPDCIRTHRERAATEGADHE